MKRLTEISYTITVIDSHSFTVDTRIKVPISKEEFFNLLDLLHTMIYAHYADESSLRSFLEGLSYSPEEISELIKFTITYEFGFYASSQKEPEYTSCTRFYEHFIAQFYS